MTDTCIIGAGPAGLAMARALTSRGLPYTHLERHAELGGLWNIDSPGTPMYESAHFISSRTMSAFDSYPMPDTYPDYPSQRQVLGYLKGFADTYDLTDAIEFNTEVTHVEATDDGRWRVTRADARTSEHDNVVAASGVLWYPNEPSLPGHYTGEVRHSVTYRSPGELKGRRVLVVGAGNSGCDIACDAATAADHAVISVRRGYWFIPKHILGVPSDVFGASGPPMPMWLEQRVFGALLRVLVGDLTKLGLPKPDHKLFETHPILNDQLLHHLRHGDVTARPAIATTDGTTVTFTDGSTEGVDLILLATGYRHAVPYAQGYFGGEQHPDLYLNGFSKHPGLFGMFIETNASAFPLLDQLAGLIAAHIDDRQHHPDRYASLRDRIEHDRPDLSGGIRFVDSPRHRGYVDSTAYRHQLTKVARELGHDQR